MRPSCYRRWASSVGLVIAMTPALAAAQGESRTYTDSRGKKVVFPLGEASFADEVVSFEIGKPAPGDKRWIDPKLALGPPDYNPKTASTTALDLVLGCAGTLIVRFNDNVLVDAPGADLYVFEVGPNIEGVRLAISPDGITSQIPIEPREHLLRGVIPPVATTDGINFDRQPKPEEREALLAYLRKL